MPAQKHETRKNYIGLVADETEESRAVNAARSEDTGRVTDYVRDLMTAVLKRGKAQ